jgi:hypothetical protein
VLAYGRIDRRLGDPTVLATLPATELDLAWRASDLLAATLRGTWGSTAVAASAN